MTLALNIALMVAVAFVALGLWRRARPAWVAAVMWLAYAGYEAMMVLRIWCSGECNIRVDLLLFIPVLLWVSIVALVKTARQPRA